MLLHIPKKILICGDTYLKIVCIFIYCEEFVSKAINFSFFCQLGAYQCDKCNFAPVKREELKSHVETDIEDFLADNIGDSEDL